ncbi:hypothetical protein NDU88_006107 [Pleurodeles waltl]|uniref:Uncharacterized protein n=1 Tax=Pleurodeles waltl TaxID=8319 RepID=A0AAV7TXH3_PLEWA|nr:hypothetical protein NDU88_006107 [Pleurodeles waltl]
MLESSQQEGVAGALNRDHDDEVARCPLNEVSLLRGPEGLEMYRLLRWQGATEGDWPGEVDNAWCLLTSECRWGCLLRMHFQSQYSLPINKKAYLGERTEWRSGQSV